MSEERAVVQIQESSLEAQTRGEFSVLSEVAHRYPRDIEEGQRKAVRFATMSEETAGECHYCLPRAGKEITGPSVRLAEIAVAAYGNVRISTRIADISETHITAQAVCIDLESNVGQMFEVKRRITNKTGQRFNDDMIVVAGNAASSIAYRNAALKTIPKAFWGPAYAAAQQLALNSKTPIGERRQKAMAFFLARGITEDKLFGKLGIAKMSELGPDQLTVLRGFANSVVEGDASMAEIFAEERQAAPQPVAVLNLGSVDLQAEKAQRETTNEHPDQRN
jgi:hypothetical protein